MAIAETTVREIALEQPASIRVFEQLGIDYCCGGRKPLAQACAEHALDLDHVLQTIAEASAENGEVPRNWEDESLSALCRHIAARHHGYIRSELPRLEMLMQKVVSRHGNTQPELGAIQSILLPFGRELLEHLDKEEMVLFPYISNLQPEDGICRPLGCFGSVRHPIARMMAEHDGAGEAMARMRELSSGFTAPDWACPTYRGLYQALREFERDLHQHVHLENNILFPRAIQLEQTIPE